MTRPQVTRQRIRRFLLLFALLVFPITLNYFSPYIIIDGASQGIINGSFIVFASLFLSSLFVGRLFCGWACPVGGLGETCFAVNDLPVNGKKIDWIKWMIWVPWIVGIGAAVISAGGYHRVDPFLKTETGFTLTDIYSTIIYFSVLGIFTTLALLVGRRGGCHTICWMAPFMILGRKLRNLLNTPALRLAAERNKCTNCKKCTANCPMSLDVNGMVNVGKMEHSECILCGSCVDGCPSKVIRYSFSSNR